MIKRETCPDWSKAGELGFKKAYELIKKTVNRKRFQLLPSETLFISLRYDDSRYSGSGKFDASHK